MTSAAMPMGSISCFRLIGGLAFAKAEFDLVGLSLLFPKMQSTLGWTLCELLKIGSTDRLATCGISKRRPPCSALNEGGLLIHHAQTLRWDRMRGNQHCIIQCTSCAAAVLTIAYPSMYVEDQHAVEIQISARFIMELACSMCHGDFCIIFS